MKARSEFIAFVIGTYLHIRFVSFYLVRLPTTPRQDIQPKRDSCPRSGHYLPVSHRYGIDQFCRI
jgi:hypothetical protein